MNFEILAPAGSREALIAGVRSGANAIYLGGKAMNARRNAGNFDDEELGNAVKYCHNHGVKIYLTVNTLVDDTEFEKAYEFVKYAVEIGVDAFIVQDLGLAKMMRECFPDAVLHASTQTSVMTPDGFKALEELGFKRAVVPREMTADEIKEIRKSTSMELEMFVHGALCMSVSGQCYLSAMLGGRSGNRGLCAQPCRLPFSADNSKSHDLSLKDLSLIEHLSKINECGVFSLKIEGRMKRPEFVAAAVSACKKAINNEYLQTDKIKLRSVFSRSGFTDGYFVNDRGYDMFGTRQKDDVTLAKDVLKDFSHLYDNENSLIPMDMYFTLKNDETISLSAKAFGKSVFVCGDNVPEKAINKPLTDESLRSRLSKLGGTQFYANNIEIDMDDGLIVPASAINELRRKVAEQLAEKLEETKIQKINPFIKKDYDKEKRIPYFTARFENASQIPNNHPFKRIFIPIWEQNSSFKKFGAGAEIPRGLFGKEAELKNRLNELKSVGVTKILAGNLGSYKTARDMGFEVFGDFGLNVFNSYSDIENPILSFELTLDRINKLSCNGEKGIIAYGYLPLMLTRNCPIKNNIGCERCKKNGTLTDRKGISFSVKCSPYPCVELFNSVPIWMADRINEINTDFIQFYFSKEEKSEIEQIIKAYKLKVKQEDNYTRGLYYRGVE